MKIKYAYTWSTSYTWPAYDAEIPCYDTLSDAMYFSKEAADIHALVGERARVVVRAVPHNWDADDDEFHTIYDYPIVAAAEMDSSGVWHRVRGNFNLESIYTVKEAKEIVKKMFPCGF